jgi:signal transduction histidine kinase
MCSIRHRLLWIIVIIYFSCSNLWAQEPDLSKIPSTDGKMKAWIEYCEALRLNGSSAPDNFKKLQIAGQKGLEMVKPGDFTNRSKCFFYIAIGNYYQLRFDSAQYYFYKSLTDAQTAHNTAQITKACVALIPVNFQLQQQDKVEVCKNILQSIADTTRNEIILQDLDYALGSYYQQKSYYSTAQDYFIKSIELREKEVDTTQNLKKKFDYAIQCDMLSKLYLNTEMVDKSLDVLRKGARFASVSPNVDNRLLSSFVEAQTSSGNIDSALFYDAKLENNTRNNPMFPSEQVSSDLNIALYYIKKSNFGRAVLFLDRADTIVNRVKSPLLTFQSQMVRGRYFQETGQYDRSVPILMQAMPVAKQFSKELYANVLKYLALDEKGSGNAKAALQYYEEYVQTSDSINKEKLSRTFADLETHYQTNEKEQQIKSLDKENRLKLLELQTASREQLLLIFGLGALGVISLLLYFIYRNKEKLNLILNDKNASLDQMNHHLAQANETKARLFGIIGHDLRSPVSKIVQLLQLQKERPELLSEDQRARHQEMLKKTSENVLETMEDLLIWSKSQMENFTPDFAPVEIRRLVEKEIGLLKDQDGNEQIMVNQQVPETFIKKTDENFLAIILRNLLQNAFRYGDRSKPCSVKANEDELVISNFAAKANADSLNDQISNARVDSNANGLGLQIAADLASRINVKLHFRQAAPDRLEAVLSWKEISG